MNISTLRLESRAVHLSKAQQIAIAAAVAEHVLPLFARRWPSEGEELRSAILFCWSVADDKTQDNEVADMWTIRVNELVPDSEAVPDAGAAIPAGETVLAALYVSREATVQNTLEAVHCGYTAVEMDAFLSLPETDGAGSRSGEEVDQMAERAVLSASVQAFLELVDRLLVAAEDHCTSSEIRALTGRGQ